MSRKRSIRFWLTNIFLENVCKNLNLKLQDNVLSVACLNENISLIRCKSQVKMFSIFNSFTADAMCLVISSITGKTPVSHINIPVHVQLALSTSIVLQSKDNRFPNWRRFFLNIMFRSY